MRKVVVSVAALVACAASALAADMPAKGAKKAAAPVVVSPWDIAFGGALMSDYNFRGISQTDRGPGATAYFEPRYNVNPNWQLYAGIAGSTVDLPTDPSAEIDLYAGVRPTLGPLALDLGFIYYYYPNESQHATGVAGATFPSFPNGNATLANTDYWEVYAKPTWTVNDVFALGGNLYYTPSWLNTGAKGVYASATAKLTAPAKMFAPNWGAYLSGEFGHQALGTTNFVPLVLVNNAGTGGIQLPDYNYWNLGVGFTYKVLTLDLRYHDTNLSKAECNALSGDPTATATAGVIINNFTTTAASNWCNSTFVAKLSFDTSLAAFK